jgi:hypothetical protein
MSFSQFKKNKIDLASISKRVDELTDGNRKSFKDDRFWKPTVDKAGNGSAVIRFLPAADGEDLPWNQFHKHNFDHNGSYFIELCPTKLGRECPVCKANTKLWKTEIKENKDLASARKRKLIYVSNILVLKDKEAPENEGKVFLYEYGQKIFDKIKAQLKPKDEEDQAVVVFDLWDGADFRIEIKKVAGYRNYDDSTFRNPAPLFKGDDAKLEVIYNQLHALLPFTTEDKFKSYEELEKKLEDLESGASAKVSKKVDELFGDTPKSAEADKPKKTRKPKDEDESTAPWDAAVRKPTAASRKPVAPPTTEPETSEEEVAVEDDNDLDYYNELSEKD